MTLRYLVNQLHGLSVNGEFNGVRFSKKELADYIRNMFRTPLRNDRLVMTVVLPDGEWYFWIKRRGRGWDYWIPETREQENNTVWF